MALSFLGIVCTGDQVPQSSPETIATKPVPLEFTPQELSLLYHVEILPEVAKYLK
jgi:hypothetical protein